MYLVLSTLIIVSSHEIIFRSVKKIMKNVQQEQIDVMLQRCATIHRGHTNVSAEKVGLGMVDIAQVIMIIFN